MFAQKHKHFVALPIFLIAMLCIATSDRLVATVLQETPRAAAVSLRASTQPVAWNGKSGIAVALDTQSSISIDEAKNSITLTDGSVIVSASGFGIIHARSSTVHILHGSVLVLQDATSTTVVALRAPLVIETNESQTLLPRGYQMHIIGQSHEVSQVPADWLQQKIRSIPPSIDSTLSSSAKAFFDVLAVSKCTVYPTSAISPSDASAILASVLAGDNGSADCSETVTRLLPLDTVPTRVQLLLALAAERRPVDDLLAEIEIPVSLDKEFALAVLQEETATIRPLPLSVLNFFTHSVERFASGSPDDAFASLVQPAEKMAQIFDEAGYPESAKQWQEASDTLYAFIAPLLPAAKKKQVVAPVPVVDERVYDPQQVVALANQYLRSSALLFTTETTITYDAKARVRIAHAYVATAHGDSEISCTFDTATQLVSDIVLGAIPLPNSVPLAKLAQSF